MYRFCVGLLFSSVSSAILLLSITFAIYFILIIIDIDTYPADTHIAPCTFTSSSRLVSVEVIVADGLVTRAYYHDLLCFYICNASHDSCSSDIAKNCTYDARTESVKSQLPVASRILMS